MPTIFPLIFTHTANLFIPLSDSFNVSFKTVSGESNACTDEMVAPWEQTTLPTILSKYDLNQIYNANEFGLFYRTQPNNSLHEN